jgi:hypothetical protein
MEINISQECIRAHWMPVISSIMEKAGKDPDFRLDDWEIELWAPAITGLSNRYIPAWLSAIGSPEWAMFMAALTTYIVMRLDKFAAMLAKYPWAAKLIGISGPVTLTQVSSAAPASSESPGPEKRIVPFSSSAAAAGLSTSTQ